MKNRALEIFVAFLAVLLLFSYTPLFTGKSKGKKICLVKKNEVISEFSIKQGEKSLVFLMGKNQKGEGGFWKCSVTEDVNENQAITFPVEQKTVKNALEQLKGDMRLYKFSDSKSDLDSLFAEGGIADLSVSVLSEKGRNLSIKTYDTFLGKLDFTGKKRYVSFPSKKDIWKCDYDFLEFSSADENFWLDPYVFPENLFPDKKNVQLFRVKYSGSEKLILPENIDMEKLLRLRHGNLFFKPFAESPSQKNSDMRISVEFGKGNFLSMDFYKSDDENMIISYSSNEWNYSVRLSSWTYSVMLNLLGLSGENHDNE
ncbi:MAG: hypothetical protein ACTTJG_02650 [Treponema sp.]